MAMAVMAFPFVMRDVPGPCFENISRPSYRVSVQAR
jgi:hypothetical protein